MRYYFISFPLLLRILFGYYNINEILFYFFLIQKIQNIGYYNIKSDIILFIFSYYYEYYVDDEKI